MNHDASQLPAQFESAARDIFITSPLYQALCRGMAGDPELLALSAGARREQPAFLIILAAVHALTLRGIEAPLTDLYRQIARGEPLDRDPFPLFRAFCREHSEQLAPLIASGRVQTNEVGRAVYIALALTWLSHAHPERVFSVVELGASAGLNLPWDRFAMDFVDAASPTASPIRIGAPSSSVQLRCSVRGNSLPALFADVGANVGAPFVERLGLELDPLDITSPDTADWLKACVWADQPKRLERLSAAIALSLACPWRVLQADVTTSLQGHVAALRTDTWLCLVHTHLIHQLAAPQRDRLYEQISAMARQRPVFVVAMEPTELTGPHMLTVTEWRAGERADERVLAVGELHGRTVEWIAES